MNKGDLVAPIANHVDGDPPALIIKSAYGVVIMKEARLDGKVVVSEETKVVDILFRGKIYTEIPIKDLMIVKSKIN